MTTEPTAPRTPLDSFSPAASDCSPYSCRLHPYSCRLHPVLHRGRPHTLMAFSCPMKGGATCPAHAAGSENLTRRQKIVREIFDTEHNYISQINTIVTVSHNALLTSMSQFALLDRLALFKTYSNWEHHSHGCVQHYLFEYRRNLVRKPRAL